jgi:hypothetical protein
MENKNNLSKAEKIKIALGVIFLIPYMHMFISGITDRFNGGGGWAIYDFRDISVGICISAIIGLYLIFKRDKKD